MTRTLLTALVVLSLCCARAQTGRPFTLRGYFAGHDSDKVVLNYNPTGKAFRSDTAYLINGRFIFEGVLLQPDFAGITVYPDTGGRDLYSKSIYLDPTSMEVVLDTANHNYPKVKGGITQQVFLELVRLRSAGWGPEYAFYARHPGSVVVAGDLDILLANKDMPYDSARKYAGLLQPSALQSIEGRRLGEELERAAPSQPGQPAPLFDTVDVWGRPVSLAAFHGKAVILDFWASWCKPCRAFTPHLKELSRHYREGLAVVCISLDWDTLAWKKAIAEDSIGNFLQVRTDNRRDSHLKNLYGVQPIPSEILIDPSGKIVGRYMGAEAGSQEDLDKALAAMLRE